MTNDEYQAIAPEQRRREEEAAFRRNLQEQQERQQRQREEARRLANHSRSMGQMGALPTFGAPLNAGAYQEGLWEYQRRQIIYNSLGRADRKAVRRVLDSVL